VPQHLGPLENETVRDLIVPLLRDRSGWVDEQLVFEYRLKERRTISAGGVARTIDDGYADIVLEATPGTPVAVVEAKRKHKTATDAIQQAIRYAQQLDAPLAYGSNGQQIIERNLRTGVERTVTEFADPATAWSEYCQDRGLDTAGADLVSKPFNRRRRSVTGHVVTPRYYQVTAINRVLTAIAQGDRRVLLLMATGTGKTFTAMQIVAKLRAHEKLARPNRNYRVLYLADRDQLLTQPMTKDFAPAFGNGLLQRVLGKADQSREIYFASYQALSGGNPDNATDATSVLFEAFRPDFFDLVIVDECHRGSAEENSTWRKVLDYFDSAVQLGLTATPRDDTVRSYEYFGNPVFKYSLRDGIADGYLAPYRVRRVVLSPDVDGWEPDVGELDRFKRVIPPGTYTTRDFERVVSLLARTRLAAHHLSKTLRQDPTARAIVFCVDTEHANDMRQALIDENPDLVAADPEWVVRIVGVENERERLLGDFTDPETSSPVIATTSRLLSTGVDIEDLKYVVLFRVVGSMIEFKQIIGRGTRLYPDKDKHSFEIIDYVGATRHFTDPAFDGYPANIVIETVDSGGEVASTEPVPPEDEESGEDEPEVNEPEPPFTVEDPPAPPPPPTPPSPRSKYYVDEGLFEVASEARLVPSVTGQGIVLTEYGQHVRDRVRLVGSESALRTTWANAESRHKLIAMLADDGIDLAELVEAAGQPDADPLDALFHLAWDLPVRTRSERVRRVRETRSAELAAMNAQARAILEGLLQRYETHGVEELESAEVFRLDPLNSLGTPVELAKAAGGPTALRAQLGLVQEWLYA
jgi:type I restriction enzyme R subunit